MGEEEEEEVDGYDSGFGTRERRVDGSARRLDIGSATVSCMAMLWKRAGGAGEDAFGRSMVVGLSYD